LYFDECVDARIIAGARRRHIDSVTAADEGLLGASDDEQLKRAIQLGRVIVTADPDFFQLVHARLEAGATFPGLLFVPNGSSVGSAVRGLEIVGTIFDPEDMVDGIEWVC
jgi:hypothetical protein